MEAVARITALDPDPRYPEAIRIEIDGVRFGAVPRELIAAERLQVGVGVAPGAQDRLSVAADAEAAFRTMLRVLAVRSFARADLSRRLQRKGHPRAAIQAATERAAGLGLLDDAAFAQGYVETRAARGRGPARLARDLMAMGVERSVIDAAIASQWPEGSDRSAVPLALAHKRVAQLGSLPRQTKRRRLVAYLARRGFTGREITDMVERVVQG
jgi:regulatory protein